MNNGERKKTGNELSLFSEGLKEKVKDLPPFFRDMSFAIKPRTYFFYESKPNSNPPPEKKISEAWALNGSLAYESGLWLDRFAVGAELFTSQRLYGPEDHDGTKLLAPGQHGYTVMGQLYGKLKLFDDHSVTWRARHLQGSLGGDVSLEAWWMVLSGDGEKMVLTKKSTFTEAVAGQDYKSLVSAQSRTLGHLSREIAEAIKILPK